MLLLPVLSACVLWLLTKYVFSSVPGATSKSRPACFNVDGRCVPYYLSIFALIKNETAYVAEWLEYHLLVGVDKFWIVDNDSGDNPAALLAPYIAAGVVNLTSWPGRGQHYLIQWALCPKLNDQTFWLALIDVDEFLVPAKGRSVPAILRLLKRFPAISVNWLVYGTNGQLHKKPGLVLERFPNHTAWKLGHNRFTKIIANPRQILEFRIHEHLYFGAWRSHDPLGRSNDIPMFHRPACHQVLWLNHYWTKSKEEFTVRRVRGPGHSADPKDAEKNVKKIAQDLALVPDVVSNDRTIEWTIQLVKENLGTRSLPFEMQKFHLHSWRNVIVRPRKN